MSKAVYTETSLDGSKGYTIHLDITPHGEKELPLEQFEARNIRAELVSENAGSTRGYLMGVRSEGSTISFDVLARDIKDLGRYSVVVNYDLPLANGRMKAIRIEEYVFDVVRVEENTAIVMAKATYTEASLDGSKGYTIYLEITPHGEKELPLGQFEARNIRAELVSENAGSTRGYLMGVRLEGTSIAFDVLARDIKDLGRYSVVVNYDLVLANGKTRLVTIEEYVFDVVRVEEKTAINGGLEVHTDIRGISAGTKIPKQQPIKLSGSLRDHPKGCRGFWGFSDMAECPPIDTSELTSAYGLFYRCEKLQKLPESLDLSNVSDLESMITESGMKEISVFAPLVTSASRFAQNCHNLESITLDLPKCLDAKYLVSGCNKLTLLSLNLPRCNDASLLAIGCSSLESTKLELPECTIANHMFNGCSALISLELDLPMCENISYLINGGENLKSLTLNLPKCTNTDGFVNGCNNLKNLKIKNLKTSLYLASLGQLTFESVKYIIDNAQSDLSRVILTLPRALMGDVTGDESLTAKAIEKGLELSFR